MRYNLEDASDVCFPVEIEGSVEVDMQELFFGKKSKPDRSVEEGEAERLAEQEKELEEEAELVDELTVKYGHLAADQRARIQKLAYADEEDDDWDPFQQNFVDHQGVVQEESPRHAQRRQKLEEVVVESERKGEKEGALYAILGVIIIAGMYMWCNRSKLRQRQPVGSDGGQGSYTGIQI